jgi:hypothetical protein
MASVPSFGRLNPDVSAGYSPVLTGTAEKEKNAITDNRYLQVSATLGALAVAQQTLAAEG